MARGAEAKLRKKSEKKEARAAEAAEKKEAKKTGVVENDFEMTEDDIPMPPGMGPPVESDTSADEAENETPAVEKKKSKKKKKTAGSAPPMMAQMGGGMQPSSEKKKIKTLPLVMLILLTGSTVLPALIYAGDWAGNFVQRHHVLGALGHKLGVGATPKKRVLSFYEKHDPEKLDDIPKIMAKYYGDYPKLVKRLERRYQDYGYFKDWEQDEAPMKLAMEKFEDTYEYLGKQWMKHAPSVIKTGARNARQNFKLLYRKGHKIWKKNVWPTLEPFFGVPQGGAAQKRKDKEAARARKGHSKKNNFRDDEEM